MIELELEKTFLAKALPDNIVDCRSEFIQDIYVPQTKDHATLRLRQRGERYEITKKVPIDGQDSTRQHEHTISLDKEEYEALAKCSKKIATKHRFYCEIEGYQAEIDLYRNELSGLVVIDFEFKKEEDMQRFIPPQICLADVSQEAFMAGGKLAGKTYQEIEPELKKYNYKPLYLTMQGEI